MPVPDVQPDIIRASILVDLTRELFERTRARNAARLLQLVPWFTPTFDPRTLLVSASRRIERTVGIEDLLRFSAALATADIAHVLPRDIPDPLSDLLRRSLASPVVKGICKTRRRILPLLLSERLMQRQTPGQDAESVDIRLFQWFLDLWIPFQHDTEIAAFLSSVYADVGESSALESAESMRVERGISPQAEGTRNHLDSAALGFFSFCAYCEEFYRLIEACEGAPLFQAAMWHSHLDWPTEHQRIERAMLDAIRRHMERLAASQEPKEADAWHDRRLHTENVVRRLFDHPPVPQQWSAFWESFDLKVDSRPSALAQS